MKKPGNKFLIRISAMFTALFLTSATMPGQDVIAAGKIDTNRQGSLTITHYSVDEELIKGVESRIYQIASVDENGVYSKEAPFDDAAAFPIDDINSIKTQEDWDKCLEPAREYIKEYDVKAYASAKGGSNGKTVYSNLDLGIYLVISDAVIIGNYKHTFTDFFVAVPNLEKDSDDNLYYNYNVSASPKRARVDITQINDYSVHKRWSDSGNSDKRPSSITVKIYCDDALYKTIELSSKNSWSYSWKYEAGHSFKVVETSTGNNYTASVSSDGFEFIITNTYNPPPTPDEPTPDEPVPDIPEVLGAIRDLPEVLGARRLPQTGLLWWPIPILVILGIALIFKGIKKNSEG